MRLTLGLTMAIAGLAAPALRAAPAPPADPAGVEFFEKKVRPLLTQQCYKCHSASSAKLKANLYLDSQQGALQGGDTGPAVVPGNPSKSLLIEAVQWSNKDLQMPPKKRLADAEVADLLKWVQMGAPWPAEVARASATTRPAVAAAQAANYERLRKEFWAWQPIVKPPTPVVGDLNWPRSEIDRFVISKLEQNGVRPNPDADRGTLIRRLTFDLTGLPPTPQEVAAFVSDKSADAYPKLVDRLLASAAYGEKWGRHWLDIARYAESTGSTRNVPYPQAWRYRDYVIDSFNQDKPYDKFITEQIAGDLLPYSTPAQHNEQVVATGFLALGVKDLNEKDRFKFEMDNVDEQIDVTSRAVLALTISCARCHDHKFDPIPTADYYSMAGIFRSTEVLAGVHPRQGGKGLGSPAMLVHLDKSSSLPTASPAPVDPQQIQELTSELDQARAQLARIENGQGPAKFAKPQARKLATILRKEQVEALQADIDALKNGSSLLTALGVRDATTITDANICIHGDTDNLGPQVSRGFISLLPVKSVSSVSASQSGRVELAQWLTSRDNPMTPRVIVNRIWAHLFGQGLVRTVDNFGSTGEAPSHPELLDYLATQFMDHGWSIKAAIRSIVLSRAYQLSSAPSVADAAVDPGDRFVWRMNPRRLEAEQIRDAMLAASGDLNPARPLGSPVMALPVLEIREKGKGKYGQTTGALDSDSTHRSVYLPVIREMVPPVLEVFDFAEPSMVIGSRDTTVVATQALFLMNDPFVLAESRAMAQRVLTQGGIDDAKRVDLAYSLTLCRAPTTTERRQAMRFISDFALSNGAIANNAASARNGAWASFCQVLFASAEFRYLN